VALGRDLVPDFADFAVCPDPERHAHDSEEGFSQKAFHPPRAIGFDHLELGIREQRKV